MGLLGPVLVQLLLLGVTLPATAAKAQAKPGCPHNCGSLTIPYPFGTKEGCYLDDSFLITCNNSNPFLGESNIEVLDISLKGQLRVSFEVAYDCYDAYGEPSDRLVPWISLSAFPISYTQNKFTAVGCDTNAVIQGSSGHKYNTGCMSLCDTIDDVIDGSCSGIGCCQTSIPKGIREVNINVSSYNNHSDIHIFNPCSYAFVVEEGKYNFSLLDLADLQGIENFPLVLDWAIGYQTCEDAKMNSTAYACKENAACFESDNGPGYRCNCSDGYQGNPYLSNGCQDIDECEDPSLNQCTSRKFCHNTEGNYTCFCPKGYHGNGRKDGQGCTADQSLWTKIVVGVSVGLSIVFGVIFCSYWGLRKRNISKLKEKNFKENGGLMLQQLISKMERSAESARIFTEEELKKATHNFSESKIVGQGGYGTVYKGILEDNRMVAIKKSKVVDRDQIDQFVNEVIILSQINHPNVVKLLGCCLETPVPLLVYEFITNRTLYHHLHDEQNMSSMPWDTRLRIAAETAGALAHMHSDAPMHIIHRDVKSANILLNDEFTAKVADFGVSRLVPLDQTHLSTLVQGTFGYIDPEYFQSGLLNEKSDVYSFGVILVELLTGEKVFSPARPDKDKSLAAFFISSMKDDHLFQILDNRVKNEGHPEQLKRVAKLAKRCLRLKGEKRPTMNNVKRDLEELRFNKHQGLDTEETKPFLSPPVNFNGSNTPVGYYSIRNAVILQLDSER